MAVTLKVKDLLNNKITPPQDSGEFQPPPLTFGAKILGQYAHILFNASVEAIIYYLQKKTPPSLDLTNYPDDLRQNGACFVTLERDGRLRGCVGTLTAHRPLIADSMANSIAAAFHDGRFSPITVPELAGLTLSYSVLSPMQERPVSSEQELLDLLVPFQDGLLIESDGKRAVYLPQVWEQLPDKKIFLQQLKLKAGMPADHWANDFKAWTYRADKTTAMPFPPVKGG